MDMYIPNIYSYNVYKLCFVFGKVYNVIINIILIGHNKSKKY